MENIREKYKVEPKKQPEKKDNDKKRAYEYPFGAEEMLLDAELKALEEPEGR